MALADLIERRKAAAASGISTANTPDDPVVETTQCKGPGKGPRPETAAAAEAQEPLASEEPSPAAEEPWGVANVVTPSGTQIYYQAGPKRLYLVDGEEVPSVSTVLQVLEKGGLSWWGMKVGVEGVLELLKRPEVVVPPDADAIVALLKEHRLTVNHVKDKAADRGTNVHSALEGWFENGVIPDPQFYPENERGYVAGLVAFLNDAQPLGHASEVMVGVPDGYAGRFDLLASFEGEVVVKTYPKRKPVREAFESSTWLLDLKTSKGVYPSYHLQLAAYEYALEACGYEAPDHSGVLRVTDDGRYELVEGRAHWEQFTSVLEVYHAIKEIG